MVESGAGDWLCTSVAERLPERGLLRRARPAQERMSAADFQLNPKERFSPLHWQPGGSKKKTRPPSGLRQLSSDYDSLLLNCETHKNQPIIAKVGSPNITLTCFRHNSSNRSPFQHTLSHSDSQSTKGSGPQREVDGGGPPLKNGPVRQYWASQGHIAEWDVAEAKYLSKPLDG